MAVSRVLTRGQVTLPSAIRRSAGIKPGDLVIFTVKEPGKVELEVVPRMTLAEMLEKYHIDEPIDEWYKVAEEWQDIAARDVFGRS